MDAAELLKEMSVEGGKGGEAFEDIVDGDKMEVLGMDEEDEDFEIQGK